MWLLVFNGTFSTDNLYFSYSEHTTKLREFTR